MRRSYQTGEFWLIVGCVAASFHALHTIPPEHFVGLGGVLATIWGGVGSYAYKRTGVKSDK